MEQKISKLYTSAPIQNVDKEQRLEKNINEVKNFIISLDSIKVLITYFERY